MSKKTKDTTVDIDYADQAVPKEGRKGFLTMFMIMLGFTFFSASMWVGQQMAAGLDFWEFIKSLLLGGAILGVYTGLLGYVGAKTGLSMDLLAKRAFGEKGSYLSSAMISFTQIGWFGVGVAMFAIPVSGELLGGSKAAMWALVLVAGGCMTASAYFGIDSLTVVSYIAVPLVAILGTVAMVMAVRQGNGTIVDQFAVSSGSVTVISRSFFADSSIHALRFLSLLLRLLSFDFSLCILLAQAGQYFDIPELGTYSTPHTVQFLGFNAVHRFVGVICNSPTKPMNL